MSDTFCNATNKSFALLQVPFSSLTAEEKKFLTSAHLDVEEETDSDSDQSSLESDDECGMYVTPVGTNAKPTEYCFRIILSFAFYS